MSDKEFVLSIYPEAYIHKNPIDGSFGCYYLSQRKLSWFYNPTENLAWKEAANDLYYQINRKLES